MKVTLNEITSSDKYPYLAKDKWSGRLVLVGRYSAIMLDGENGNGWAYDKEGKVPDILVSLPPGTTVKLVQD